jgi:hypothetical protein
VNGRFQLQPLPCQPRFSVCVCHIDGDTIGLGDGRPNVRLVRFNAPETGGRARCEADLAALTLCGKQFGDADQVIGDQIEQEVGGDAADATMFGLAHGAMLLAPSEDALDHRPA